MKKTKRNCVEFYCLSASDQRDDPMKDNFEINIGLNQLQLQKTEPNWKSYSHFTRGQVQPSIWGQLNEKESWRLY